jgi:hypothetical protein
MQRIMNDRFESQAMVDNLSSGAIKEEQEGDNEIL